MLQAPGDDSRWFVLEKDAAPVRVFANNAESRRRATSSPLAVNANSEGGLLGMAFHPQLARRTACVYLSFTEGTPMVSVVARFTMSAGGATLDPATRLDIIRVNQPRSTITRAATSRSARTDSCTSVSATAAAAAIHSGTAQDTTDLLGSISCASTSNATSRRPMRFRRDGQSVRRTVRSAGRPHGGRATTAPRSTPGACAIRGAGASIRLTGDLWVGDVGQGALEEIDRVQRGGNYGWNCREGSIAYRQPGAELQHGRGSRSIPCTNTGARSGFSVTGGYVYRGTALPALVGRYLFADYGSGRIWRLVPNGGGFTSEELLDTSLSIASFGQGNDGELYVVDIARRRRCTRSSTAAAAPPPGPPVPTLLSATGCVNPQNPASPRAASFRTSPRRRSGPTTRRRSAGSRSRTARRSASAPTATSASRTARCS